MVEGRSHPARFGWIIALVALILDQVTKHLVLDVAGLTEGGAAITVAPVAELRLVWNRGISYGLFQQGADFGRWVLVAISVVAAIALAVWLTRVTNRVIALAVGLILAGAIGNAIDRAAYGAVIDFIYLFSPDRSFKWFVFNLADAWIVAGVAALLYDSVIMGRRQ